jgi:hypothetical protein
MTDIMTNIGLIVFWFLVVVVTGTFYLWAVIFAIKKGWLGRDIFEGRLFRDLRYSCCNSV